MLGRPVFTPVLLTSITTSDGELLSGVVADPKGRKKAAVVWVHGLTSSFDGGQTLMRLMIGQLSRIGVGYFKFNTRGYALADYGRRARGKSGFIGGGFERFTDCVKDIEAVVRLARQRGYKKIFLVGHSTGANKIVYYAARRPRAAAGLVLLAPVSDIVGYQKHQGRTAWREGLREAKRLARKDPKTMMPPGYGILSAGRWLSLYRPGLAEDTFPWYDPAARWAALRTIRKPLLVVFGSKDKYLDRPATEVIKIFRARAARTRDFVGQSLAGAPHGFQDYQYLISRTIARWIEARR